jgi:N-acetylmuramoyl-L-alanine amidase
LGHSDVAPARKEDPGERFPWERLARAGIGLWPVSRDANLDAEALGRFGYDLSAGTEAVVTAFQRHFRPGKVDGVWDRDCARLLAWLLTAPGV